MLFPAEAHLKVGFWGQSYNLLSSSPILVQWILGNKLDFWRPVNAANKRELFLVYPINQDLIHEYSINET